MTHHTTAQRLKVPFSDVTMYLVCPCENLGQDKDKDPTYYINVALEFKFKDSFESGR